MKVEIITICIAFLIIAIFYIIGYLRKKKIKSLEEENRILNAKVDRLQKDLSYMATHLQEILKIKNDESFVKAKIDGAKTDEEIAEIVSIIISANNDRVQDTPEK